MTTSVAAQPSPSLTSSSKPDADEPAKVPDLQGLAAIAAFLKRSESWVKSEIRSASPPPLFKDGGRLVAYSEELARWTRDRLRRR